MIIQSKYTKIHSKNLLVKNYDGVRLADDNLIKLLPNIYNKEKGYPFLDGEILIEETNE